MGECNAVKEIKKEIELEHARKRLKGTHEYEDPERKKTIEVEEADYRKLGSPGKILYVETIKPI